VTAEYVAEKLVR